MSVAVQAVKVQVPVGWGNAVHANEPSQIVAASAQFARPVKTAEVALAGFRNQYPSRAEDDHSVFEHQVVIRDVTVNHDLVHFNVHSAIQAQGATDSFTGSVTAVVIARLASRSAGAR